MGIYPSVVQSQDITYELKGVFEDKREAGKIKISYYENNKVVEDSTDVKDGEFTLNGKLARPTNAGIYYKSSRNVKSGKKRTTDYRQLYLHEGVISIKIRDSIKYAIVENSQLNKDYEAYNKIIEPFEKENYNLKGKLYREAKTADEKQLLEAKLDSLDTEQLKVKKDFITNHKDSYISLHALKEISYFEKDVDELSSILHSVSEDLKTTALWSELNNFVTATRAVSSGKMAPDFSEPDSTGTIHRLSDFKGKYVLVDFWASWCLPCRAEIPYLRKAYERFKEKNFTVIGVSIDMPDNRSSWLKALRSDLPPGIQLVNLDKGDNKSAQDQYAVTAIPANFLVDPSGKIIEVNLRGEALEKKLAEILK